MGAGDRGAGGIRIRDFAFRFSSDLTLNSDSPLALSVLVLGCVASRPLRAPYLPHPSAIFASRSLSSPSFRHWILEPLDLGFLVLLIFSSSDLLLPCVDVTDRPGYDRIFPSPPFGPRHLPVHCRLVSCTCTLLVIYTDLAAPFSHISQSSLEASTICLP